MALEKDRRPQRTRIDYFKKPHPLRTLRMRLIFACAALACCWVLYEALTADLGIYSPGPVAAAHSSFEGKCTLCHTGPPGATFVRTVSDTGCERCHAGPVHHANQVFGGQPGLQPACSFCHTEHGGRTASLRSMTDGYCTQCHRDLQADPPAATQTVATGSKSLNPVLARLDTRPANGYERSITAFDSGHPEFRLIAERFSDATPVKLNHTKHLRPELPGPGGKRVQMVCADCHRQDDRGAMKPIQFEDQCQSCHPLAFDPAIPEEAPHESPELAAAFLRTALSKYAGAHPGEWKKDPDWHPARNIASLRRMAEEAPKNLPEWVETRAAQAKSVLFERKCGECHTVENITAPIPGVVAPDIPARWFVHSSFSHSPHQALECASCHANAPTSEKTSDLLLPGRDSCIVCHNASNSIIARCTTCHGYHPPGGEAAGRRFKLEEFLK